MHASRLVELAIAAAQLHRPMVEQEANPESWRADEFWVLSRARVNEWSRFMKECERSKHRQNGPFEPRLFWRATEPILEEVFLAEVCTRIWCATLTIIDENRWQGELSPIARSVFVASLEVRRRALRLLLFSRGLPNISTTSTNALRRDCEIWTDGLLSQLSCIDVAEQFGFDRGRIRRFAKYDSSSKGGRPAGKNTISEATLRSTSIKYALALRTTKNCVCPELNSELAANLLGCLPPAGFNGCGEPNLSWGADSYCSDTVSISVLEDLCGNSTRPRYDVLGGLIDRR